MKAEMHFKIWDLGLFRRSNLSPILKLGIHELCDNLGSTLLRRKISSGKPPQVLHIPPLCTHSPYLCTAPCLSLLHSFQLEQEQASTKHTKPRPGQKIRRKKNKNKMHLARFSAVPTPSKNVVSRLKIARHNHRVLPQQGLRLPFPSPQQGHLDSPASRHPHRPPNAAPRIGSLFQVPLVKLHPRFARVVKGSDHGVVASKLEDILGETLLSDGSPSLPGHLAQPVRVTSPVTSI